ncbi:conserved hypothetical protein [Vibrio nigripulchritudo MADA3029]|uniref:Uncharacterized protein n=2 Tax=Vibrio nigripulchritudo TaxID=28173 RepID=U4KDX1_9VIBR|nr:MULTISPECIES: hypothetical protein [Vibrio]EGU51926.1 hypothetical protein VINI7043_27725 [Vibrio nigripulchritudo ATCC 27043]KJY75172.1 hypothetical protein TW74_17680 [Vibrio nigripulchritudo]UAB72745.1 hypothetical protein INR79_26195 [Vibrio sp. SCSIO 43132]CCN37249.1 conserved hypothetical protein [Vibrio nigripulchritudo AM115]CCN42365.1 conserved hypothetical protein [Vibrio nigripulchritudo FTn2]
MDFKRVSEIGGTVMIVSLLIMTATLLISFPYANHFSIIQQAIAHIGTIIFAGVFKVGYVAYIVGRYERNLSF